jgi:putative protease
MEKLLGRITHYFSKINVGIIKIENGELNVGDTIHIKGHTSDFTQTVDSMQIEHEQIQIAKRGDDIGIKVEQKVHEHDEVYLVTE